MLCHSSQVDLRVDLPRQGTTDAETKIPSAENPELLKKPGVGHVDGVALHASPVVRETVFLTLAVNSI